MGDRCTGHCCQNFYLPLSPDELDRGYRRWSGGGDQIQMEGGAKALPLYKDIHLIAPMVVHLGYDVAAPKKVNLSDEELLGKPELTGHRYRCKHFDSAAHACTIYDIRPAMCRDYPGDEGATCNFARCTWDERKAKKQTAKERRERLRVLQPVTKGSKKK